MVAVAKALADSARDTKLLAIRGGVLARRVIGTEDVEELAKLPPLDVLRGQVLAAVIAPLNAILALVNAPLQNLHGLIDARIEQLGGEDEPETAGPAEAPQEEQPEPTAEIATEETTTDTTSQIAEGDLAEDANPEEEQTDGGS